jgi:integrase
LSSTDDEDKKECQQLARELNFRNAKPITKTVEVVKEKPKEIDVFKPKNVLNMQEAYAVWLEEIKSTSNKKTKSIKDKAVWDLKQFIGPKEQLYKVGSEELQKFKFYLLNKVNNSKNTVHFKFNWIIQFFELMKKAKYYLADNPAKGQAKLSSADKDKLTDENRHLPFSVNDLQVIFNIVNYSKINKPHLFWCPIISLYTGMRVSEIGQLYIEDISIEQQSIRIQKTKEDQSIKSRYSNRVLPIHQSLIDIGFFDFVEDMKKFGPRLFPNLSKSMNGYGTRISNDFTRYLEDIGIKEDRKSFHSFRSYINQLLSKKIDWKIQHRFLGHEIEGINYKHYDREVSFDDMKENALPLIIYHLNVSIKYRRNSFDEYIQKILINKTK